MLLKALPFLTVCVSILVTLMMLVMMAAGCANAKPAQLTIMKWLALSVAAACFAGIGGAVWTFIAGRYGWSTGLGAFPTVYIVVLVIILVKIEF
jgi:hypothetical protein